MFCHTAQRVSLIGERWKRKGSNVVSVGNSAQILIKLTYMYCPPRLVKVWSLASVQSTASLQHATAIITSLCVSRLLLIVATMGGGVHLWSLMDHTPLMQWPVDREEVEREVPKESRTHLTKLLLNGTRLIGAGR